MLEKSVIEIQTIHYTHIDTAVRRTRTPSESTHHSSRCFCRCQSHLFRFYNHLSIPFFFFRRTNHFSPLQRKRSFLYRLFEIFLVVFNLGQRISFLDLFIFFFKKNLFARKKITESEIHGLYTSFLVRFLKTTEKK